VSSTLRESRQPRPCWKYEAFARM